MRSWRSSGSRTSMRTTRFARCVRPMRSPTRCDAINKELEASHGVRSADPYRREHRGGDGRRVRRGGALVTGDVVNVAARFEQRAAPGEVLIGEETLRLVRDAVIAEPVEPMELKGKSEPVLAYPLATKVIPRAAGFARRLDAPMVGRERELSFLRGAFDRAMSDDACQLFTVLGDRRRRQVSLLGAFAEELGGPGDGVPGAMPPVRRRHHVLRRSRGGRRGGGSGQTADDAGARSRASPR